VDEKKEEGVGVSTANDRWLNVLNVGVLYDVDFFFRLSASYELGP